MGSHILALALAICAALPAIGQQCPQASAAGTKSQVRTLEGTLIFHDGVRKWFELKLDQPQCGQASIELVWAERKWTPLQVLRGCRVRSRGALAFSPTGYYSLDIYQDVKEIESVGACVHQLPFPDYSHVKPDKTVREYRVDMHVDYEAGDHPIFFSVSSAGKELRPWQAYGDYSLTGGFVLYGFCAKGFVVDSVFGTPQANPSHFDEPRTSSDMAMFDPESAAAAGKKDLHLGYTCVRKP
jgi:hypothetical protein